MNVHTGEKRERNPTGVYVLVLLLPGPIGNQRAKNGGEERTNWDNNTHFMPFSLIISSDMLAKNSLFLSLSLRSCFALAYIPNHVSLPTFKTHLSTTVQVAI